MSYSVQMKNRREYGVQITDEGGNARWRYVVSGPAGGDYGYAWTRWEARRAARAAIKRLEQPPIVYTEQV